MTFGVVICHEGWRYPETVRWAARHGAHAVFHPHFHEAEPGSYRPATFADPAKMSVSDLDRWAGWSLVGAMALVDEDTPDAWFEKRLAEIERSIQTSPNAEREAMLHALIAIGCRSTALRKSVTATAKRIGKVVIDHGDTSCKTPEVAPTLEKTWARATSKGFASPAAQERARESMRTRC